MAKSELLLLDDSSKVFPELWLKISLDNEFLRRFWGRSEQPELDDLKNRIDQAVSNWLEGNDERRIESQRRAEFVEREYLKGLISAEEFFDGR